METTSVYNISSPYLSEDAEFLHTLIAKAKLGENQAFGEIYNLYFKRIYRFIFFRVGHKEVAEDLAEDVFIKAYGKISSVNENKSFDAWLYQIARNSVIDYYRQKKTTVAIEDVENTLEYETNIIDIVSLNQQQQFLLKLIKELSSEQQIVIKLKFLENLENDEIAEIIQKSEGAIRVIQHRAIAKLQELIKELRNKA